MNELLFKVYDIITNNISSLSYLILKIIKNSEK